MQPTVDSQSIPSASLDRYIDITPGVCGGRPRVAGHRITVFDIATWRLKLGMALEEIAGKYDLPMAAVYAAMAYYYEHRTEIDRRAEEDRVFIELFQQQHPSFLREKLQAQRNTLHTEL
ncbi:DUF433 domain-containing protein [soil metagenome]